MNREYHQWYSERLQRNMELLIFGHGGRAVLFFPTRMARFYDYENWGIVDALRYRINNGELQLFCVDSIDAESFYNKWAHPAGRINRHLQYEQYILHEVVPLIHAKNGGCQFEVAGCSMGAYHAVNLAMKHPWLFNKVVAMSGRFDLSRQIDDFQDLFDGYHNQDIYFNMPLQYTANLNDGYHLNALSKIEFVFAIGQTDPFFANNIEISTLLWHKWIANQLYVWECYAHRPRYWRKMVQLYL
jgi:esterase/lipase superfamily enzyme